MEGECLSGFIVVTSVASSRISADLIVIRRLWVVMELQKSGLKLLRRDQQVCHGYILTQNRFTCMKNNSATILRFLLSQIVTSLIMSLHMGNNTGQPVYHPSFSLECPVFCLSG